MKPVLHGSAGVNLNRSHLTDSEADRYFGEGQSPNDDRNPLAARPAISVIYPTWQFSLST
jgi:hypothetical protein